jgi:hypothetical protein
MVSYFWVECLALQESGLGLGIIIVPYFIPVVTQYVITFSSLLVWRIGISDDGFVTMFGRF